MSNYYTKTRWIERLGIFSITPLVMSFPVLENRSHCFIVNSFKYKCLFFKTSGIIFFQFLNGAYFVLKSALHVFIHLIITSLSEQALLIFSFYMWGYSEQRYLGNLYWVASLSSWNSRLGPAGQCHKFNQHATLQCCRNAQIYVCLVFSVSCINVELSWVFYTYHSFCIMI